MDAERLDADEHGAAVAETHSAVVFFFGDRAYKLKKAVDLDFRTRAQRQEACHREVRLNQRLALPAVRRTAVISRQRCVRSRGALALSRLRCHHSARLVEAAVEDEGGAFVVSEQSGTLLHHYG